MVDPYNNTKERNYSEAYSFQVGFDNLIEFENTKNFILTIMSYGYDRNLQDKIIHKEN